MTKWNQVDLEIQLSPSQAVGMHEMIEKFISRKQQYFCRPLLEGSTLKINSSDFVNFLDQAELSNEFDWFRLRQAALKAIAGAKKSKRDSLVTRYYQNCEEILGGSDL